MSKQLGFKKLAKLAILCVTLLSTPAFAEERPVVQSEANAFYLYTLQAKRGHIEPASSNAKQGTLVLEDVSKSVFFFSERPNRQAGKTTVAKFLSAWAAGKNSFKQDHPNAGLVFADSDKNQIFTSIGVILSQPQYDTSEDRLTFSIQVLDGKPLTKLDLGETVIFVDDLSSYYVSKIANSTASSRKKFFPFRSERNRKDALGENSIQR